VTDIGKGESEIDWDLIRLSERNRVDTRDKVKHSKRNDSVLSSASSND